MVLRQTFGWLGQGTLYAIFALFLGVFSRWPVYHPIAPDMAQIKVSFNHAGARLTECRPYTAEELARLAPNMRKAMQCERERSPVRMEVDIDGVPRVRALAVPSGLSRDGASTFYQRLEVPAGSHHLQVRFKDHVSADVWTAELSRDVDLAAAQVLVIDFNADKGGIVLQ